MQARIRRKIPDNLLLLLIQWGKLKLTSAVARKQGKSQTIFCCVVVLRQDQNEEVYIF
jgi:hypothetical protein